MINSEGSFFLIMRGTAFTVKTMKKKCNKCSLIKPIDLFISDKTQCKECKRKWQINHRKKTNNAADKKWRMSKTCREYQREYQKKLARTPEKREYWKKYRAGKGRKHYLARSKTRNLIRSGELIKKPCEVCGDKKVHAHHVDYNDPSNIKFLCKKHHLLLHKKLKENNKNI